MWGNMKYCFFFVLDTFLWIFNICFYLESIHFYCYTHRKLRFLRDFKHTAFLYTSISEMLGDIPSRLPMAITKTGRRYLATVAKGEATSLQGDKSDVKLKIQGRLPQERHIWWKSELILSSFGAIIPDNECFISPIVRGSSSCWNKHFILHTVDTPLLRWRWWQNQSQGPNDPWEQEPSCGRSSQESRMQRCSLVLWYQC